jgi:hypothetical protein
MIDHAGLLRAVEDYLAALAKRDIGALRLASDARYTEGCMRLKPGEGLWATATGLTDYRLPFADVAGKQAGCFAIVEEMGAPALLLLRLAFRDGAIREIEHLVARNGSPFFNLDGLIPPPADWSAIEPAETRSSREQLAHVADLYYESIEQADGNLVPVTDDCFRIENGVLTALNPDGKFGVAHMSVRDGNSSGYFNFTSQIRGRRYPLIDEERGLVLARTAFDMPGNIASIDVKGMGVMAMNPRNLKPSTTVVAELFKVRAGEVIRIEALLDFLPYGAPSGWEE